jgi:hypothetical protein
LIFARCPNNTNLAKGCAKGVDFEYLRYVCEVFWWFYIIKIFNFAKGIVPKIFIGLNLGRKYSNPHLNLNTCENWYK